VSPGRLPDHGSPRLTVGIPIRNGERSLVRPVESALAQVRADVEVVISDNASTDGTEELCRHYMEQDPRVRYDRLPDNIGLLANFRRVVELARGTYFRWLGADDRLDPDYARRCIEALDASPEAILVTSGSRLVRADTSHILGGLQAGPTSLDPIERLTELLRLLNEGYRAIDPVYSTIRRPVLQATGLIRSGGLDTDQVLAAELALRGPWLHIPEPLAERAHPVFSSGRVSARRFGEPARVALARQLRLTRAIHGLLLEAELTDDQVRRGRQVVWRFYLRRRAQLAGRVTGRMKSLASGRESD
jgi:glycosyltransferase involved in cell wall biosynthesis